MLLPTLLLAAFPAAQEPAPATAAEWIAQYRADQGSLNRLWSFPLSELGHQRRLRHSQEWLGRLAAGPGESWRSTEKMDYVLLLNQVERDLRAEERQRLREQEAMALLAFTPPLVELLEARAQRQDLNPEQTADVLQAAIEELHQVREECRNGDLTAAATVGKRAADTLNRLRRELRDWYFDHVDYEPMFGWWCTAPWEELERELKDYSSSLEKEVAGLDPDDPHQLLGDPIGAAALRQELDFERIAYSPEELIQIAEREFAWCQEQRRLAAEEMGLNGDWRAAQEQVKEAHAKPGEQPQMIRMLADEAVDFLDERDLVTIPELARESWRMDMMSLERQKYTPYFTGGEVISISYPAEAMAHDDKKMSMRGNNLHYSRATVHHELIPGHHLQGYMSQRWAPHRRAFYTPFLVEGWALYWEFRLWDLGFAQSAEDRIGMLFWRSHRAARIIFSLRFHLGEWSPEECIDFLVEEVGHERNNATAEVRRSIQGGYGPLYQCAYMLGGLQLSALHEELVTQGGWSERTFHDRVLHAGPIPIEYLRQELRGDPALDLVGKAPAWRF